jgi:hypothetical protein
MRIVSYMIDILIIFLQSEKRIKEANRQTRNSHQHPFISETEKEKKIAKRFNEK